MVMYCDDSHVNAGPLGRAYCITPCLPMAV